MTKTIDSKMVREARAEARKISRKGELTYQQSLDDVARRRGFAHWSAFAAAHPSGEEGETASERPLPRTARRSVTDGIRGMIAGENGVDEERARSAIVVDQAQSEGSIVKAVAVQMAMFMAGAASFMGMVAISQRVAPITTDVHVTVGSAIEVLVGIAIASAVIFFASMAIGDYPGMERRRAQAWKAMGWIQAIGILGFLTVGFQIGPVDRFVTGHLHIGIGLAQQLSLVAIVFGTGIRNGVHRLMALGAALGPRRGAGSMANLDIVERGAPISSIDAAAMPAGGWHERIFGLGKIAVFSSVASLLLVMATTVGAWLLRVHAGIDPTYPTMIGYALAGVLMLPGVAFALAVLPLWTGLVPGGDQVSEQLQIIRERRAAMRAHGGKTEKAAI